MIRVLVASVKKRQTKDLESIKGNGGNPKNNTEKKERKVEVTRSLVADRNNKKIKSIGSDCHHELVQRYNLVGWSIQC